LSVLLTGGAGYIGSHMVLELLDAGEEVVVLDNLSTGYREAVPDKAALVVGDVADQDAVTAIIREHGVNAIMHFAGSIKVPESIVDPLSYYRNNAAASLNLIECAVRTGVDKFIFSSTAAVYGLSSTGLVLEDAELKPISPYGSSKLMTEMMLCDSAQAYGLRTIILRYFNVAGADPNGRSGPRAPDATHLIRVACQTALGRRSFLEVYGIDYPTKDGTCIRDYIHVTDLVRAHTAALIHLRRGGTSEVLNCGYGSGYSVLEVIEAIKRIAGVDFEVRRVGRRVGDPAALVAGVTRIGEVLRWRPEFARLDAILDHALSWEKKVRI
jgi:UDP-glucose 4-epimerase